jgi:hypothetical protein
MDFFEEKKAKSSTLAKEKATDLQWELCDKCISQFIAENPLNFLHFKRMIDAERSKWALATNNHKELRNVSWRNAVSFPVFYSEDGLIIASLKERVEKIIPNLTHKDSVNLKKFIKRYPFLSAAESF